MEKETVRISVRNLVEFLLRSGDLDNRGGSMDREAMLKGSRLHRKIQKQMGKTYEAEVSLKFQKEYDDLMLAVEGRADGIFERDEETWIDEIKGILAGIRHLEAPVPVHRAQAMCYAAIYAEQQALEQIGVQMTYADLNTEEIRRFEESFSAADLSVWFDELLDQYHRWISWRLSWIKARNESAQQLEFPFPYRKGQRRMVGSVYHAIQNKRQIFVQAPTGVGKTMSTIFPAVRAVGEGKADTIFYLTAKTITRTVAEEAYSLLRERGLHFKTVTLTAKEKLCFCETPECNPEACPYAKGHFDRVNDAVFELLTTQNIYDREHLEEQARKWQVCPFEMTLDLTLWVDGVICDYNYVFDPDVYLKRFFAEGNSGKYLFLVDEAHNLVERSREMYSAVIDRKDVLSIRGQVKESLPRLYRALGRVNRELLELEKTIEGYEVLPNPGTLPISLMNVQGQIEALLEDRPEAVTEELLDFYFVVRSFLNISDLVDENYVVYAENGSGGKCRLKLFCVNPAHNLSSRLEKGVSTVFFSATLLPLGYYRGLLSVRDDDYGIYVESPFEPDNRLILTGTDVSSRYSRRGYEEYRKIAEYIARTVWQKKGNYMIFFPSYKLMEDVRQIYEREFSADWVECIVQEPEMDEKAREQFLEEFSVPERTLAAFCIMGGIFSEGIDLIGEKLIGAVIVGTGLPQVSNEREILKQFYEKQKGQGFDYAYRYPGMNKVLQAAGRVIRTQEDVGTILLLDDRFAQAEYTRLFPVEWNERKMCRLGTVEKLLTEFWHSTSGEQS